LISNEYKINLATGGGVVPVIAELTANDL